MIYYETEKELKQLQGLLDIALKAGGLQSLQGSVEVLNSIKKIGEYEAPKTDISSDNPTDG